MPVTVPPLKATSNAGAMPAAGRLGDARVGAHGDVHADVAGRGREHGADQEAEGLLPAERARDGVASSSRRRDHDGDDADGAVLPVQVGVRAFLDRSLDLAHALVARRLLQDPRGQIQAVRDCGEAADKGDEHVVLRQEALHGLLAPERERRRLPVAPLYGSKRTGDCNTRIPQRSHQTRRSCNARIGRRARALRGPAPSARRRASRCAAGAPRAAGRRGAAPAPRRGRCSAALAGRPAATDAARELDEGEAQLREARAQLVEQRPRRMLLEHRQQARERVDRGARLAAARRRARRRPCPCAPRPRSRA